MSLPALDDAVPADIWDRGDNDDFAAATPVTLALCERLLDNPADPVALADARQYLNDHPHWVWRARLFVASLPD